MVLQNNEKKYQTIEKDLHQKRYWKGTKNQKTIKIIRWDVNEQLNINSTVSISITKHI